MRRFNLFGMGALLGLAGCGAVLKRDTDTYDPPEGHGGEEGEGATSEGEGAIGEGEGDPFDSGHGTEGEGAGDTGCGGDDSSEGEIGFSGTFAYQIAGNDPSNITCTLYWDSEGSGLACPYRCPDCLWSMDFENTYSSDDGSCGDGSDFNWYWGLEDNYYISGYGYYPVFDYYFSGYGWYPYVVGSWDPSTGATAWAIYSYNYYSSAYTFYYTQTTYGYVE